MAPPLKTQMVVALVQEAVPRTGKAHEKIEDEDAVNVSDTGVLSFFGARAL